jgi:hypothetical protein
MVRVLRSTWSAITTAAATPAPLVSWQTAGDQEPSQLEVNLIFTNHPATVCALQTVQSLARDLGACIRLRAAIVVPYPLPVDEPPVSIPFMEHSLFDLISRLERDGFEASAHLYVCRDREKALLRVLKRNALLVIGGKKRWWPTAASRLAKVLRSKGHRVVFVDYKRGNKPFCAEGKAEGSAGLPVHSPPAVNRGKPVSGSGSR